MSYIAEEDSISQDQCSSSVNSSTTTNSVDSKRDCIGMFSNDKKVCIVADKERTALCPDKESKKHSSTSQNNRSAFVDDLANRIKASSMYD